MFQLTSTFTGGVVKSTVREGTWLDDTPVVYDDSVILMLHTKLYFETIQSTTRMV